MASQVMGAKNSALIWFAIVLLYNHYQLPSIKNSIVLLTYLSALVIVIMSDYGQTLVNSGPSVVEAAMI